LTHVQQSMLLLLLLLLLVVWQVFPCLIQPKRL